MQPSSRPWSRQAPTSKRRAVWGVMPRLARKACSGSSVIPQLLTYPPKSATVLTPWIPYRSRRLVPGKHVSVASR